MRFTATSTLVHTLLLPPPTWAKMDEKIYNKEFLTHLFESLQQRKNLGAKGFNDQSLLCNQLEVDIYNNIMWNQKENRGKQVRYFNGY